MPKQIITLKEGIRVEAEITDPRVSSKDDKVNQSINAISDTLSRVMEPVAEAWNKLPQHLRVEQAEIELGFGFEASGNLFVASSKGNVNLKVKLVVKRGPA